MTIVVDDVQSVVYIGAYDFLTQSFRNNCSSGFLVRYSMLNIFFCSSDPEYVNVRDLPVSICIGVISHSISSFRS